MAEIDQEYLMELEKLLMNDEANSKVEEGKFYTLDEDVKFEELFSSEQILISLVIDKSYPLNGNNELEKCIERTIETINNVLNQVEDLNAQVSITYFGSEIDIKPFRPTKHIKVNCIPNQVKSRIYDAIYESCMHMMGQYNYFENIGVSVKGYMFIFTDGEDNGSAHTLEDMHEALDYLVKEEIMYVLVEHTGGNKKYINNIFRAESINIDEPHLKWGIFRIPSRPY